MTTLDNIIFRSNIFNYDNKFLIELREKSLNLNFEQYIRGKIK